MTENGTANINVLNFNIGVLGHVDSGKTSLSKALSTTASTAAFDKNPQSKERGITLDLGFSSFLVDLPEHLKTGSIADHLQFTLVDCPGHASLIKTIIGGAQIIDMMMLVIDVTKGMQTQTAECLVIGEILCEKMIVVLNKVDMIDEKKREASIDKMRKKMVKTLESTRFKDCPIIPVSAKCGGNESDSNESIGLSDLIDCMAKQSYIPKRDKEGPLMFSVDHCFTIRGHGIIMTGTVLSGSVNVNDVVEIPMLQEKRKVKSMQMFRKPVKTASQGDRVGICVTQFDSSKLERGIVCTPGYLPTLYGAILPVYKIPYFKGRCQNKSKFHITIGHETVMSKLHFFGPPANADRSVYNDVLNTDLEYEFQEKLGEKTNILNSKGACDLQYVILEFDRPISCTKDSLVIGSRLDTDINLKMCRLAFHGCIAVPFLTRDFRETFLPQLKVFKFKSKEGVVERMNDDYSVIVKSLFKKETNFQLFSNMKVLLSTGEHGTIEGSFGQSGKIKVRVPNGLQAETKEKLATSKKGKGKKMEDLNLKEPSEPVRVSLEFKKYVYDSTHKMVQT